MFVTMLVVGGTASGNALNVNSPNIYCLVTWFTRATAKTTPRVERRLDGLREI